MYCFIKHWFSIKDGCLTRGPITFVVCRPLTTAGFPRSPAALEDAMPGWLRLLVRRRGGRKHSSLLPFLLKFCWPHRVTVCSMFGGVWFCQAWRKYNLDKVYQIYSVIIFSHSFSTCLSSKLAHFSIQMYLNLNFSRRACFDLSNQGKQRHRLTNSNVSFPFRCASKL